VKYGYARVFTNDQIATVQLAVLKNQPQSSIQTPPKRNIGMK
jgi:hypothetical protein